MKPVFKYLTDIRLWYALVGIFMAIVAHEAFHVIAHMGEIERIDFFPNPFTIIELTVSSPGILTHDAEEAIAYTITALILFLTIIDVFAINDSRDKRTVNEMLFPSKSTRKSKKL